MQKLASESPVTELSASRSTIDKLKERKKELNCFTDTITIGLQLENVLILIVLWTAYRLSLTSVLALTMHGWKVSMQAPVWVSSMDFADNLRKLWKWILVKYRRCDGIRSRAWEQWWFIEYILWLHRYISGVYGFFNCKIKFIWKSNRNIFHIRNQIQVWDWI